MADIGIVVPVYNGERYLRTCLGSIVAQRDISVDCIVMDGGSTDRTVALAKEYEPFVRVVSERDEGQADAIGKGFQSLSTDLVGWLNADDALLPDALTRIREARACNPQAVLFHGAVEYIDGPGRLFDVSEIRDLSFEQMRTGRGRLLQPGSFYDRRAVARSGGVDQSFHLLMDLDLWIRLLRQGPACGVPHRVAQFRVHEDAKSSQVPWRYYRETLTIARRYQADQPLTAAARRSTQILFHLGKSLLGVHRARRGVHRGAVGTVFSTPAAQALASAELLARLGKGVPQASRAGAVIGTVGQDDTLLGRANRTAQIVAIVDDARRLPTQRAHALFRTSTFFLHRSSEATSALLARGVPEFRIGRLDDFATWSNLRRLLDGVAPTELKPCET
jgi:GT2 family glycosyltransferase